MSYVPQASLKELVGCLVAFVIGILVTTFACSGVGMILERIIGR